jgi:regulator of cell morphogenesis and NO signaling
MINKNEPTHFSIADYFERDHDRLDQLYREYLQLKHIHFANAREKFISFKHGLERHITWEEEILFPLFQRKTGIVEGPVEVMEDEHRQILNILEHLNLKLQNNDRSSNRFEHDLMILLSHHNVKEENVLYPVLDHLLTQDEKLSLIQQMRNFAETGCEACCSVN